MDKEPGFFSGAAVAIIGLGLMGGSLAKALTGKCASVVGVDSDLKTLHKAIYDGVIADGYETVRRLPAGLDALILAAPIHAILQTLSSLESDFPGAAIVTDLGSTKAQILDAMQSLPPRFDPIGGHPMCGKEISGYDQSDADIFAGATFALTPLHRTSSAARRFAVELIAATGAVPFWTDAQTHDRMAAMTSHLPYLVANALAAVTPLQAAPLTGPGFLSAARLAPTPSEMMKDIIRTNRRNVLRAVNDFQVHLSQAAALLESEDDDQWLQFAGIGAEQYTAILQSRSKRNDL
jgi:prephenate dehydrogenase